MQYGSYNLKTFSVFPKLKYSFSNFPSPPSNSTFILHSQISQKHSPTCCHHLISSTLPTMIKSLMTSILVKYSDHLKIIILPNLTATFNTTVTFFLWFLWRMFSWFSFSLSLSDLNSFGSSWSSSWRKPVPNPLSSSFCSLPKWFHPCPYLQSSSIYE